MNQKRLSMKNRRLARLVIVALAAALIVALSGLGTSVAVAETTPTAVVTTGQLNIRTGPGPGYGIVGVAAQGDVLVLQGRTTNNAWVMVAVPDTTIEGWVTTLYIEASVPISTLPVTGVADPWAVVTTPVLNVRSGPGTAYSVVTTVTEGKLITLIGRTANNAYANVLTNGIEGWVSTLYIHASAPISSLPVTWIPTAVPTSTPAPGASPTPVPSASPTPVTPVPTATPVVPTAVVTTGQLNVRSGPGPGYAVLTTLVEGESVPLLGRTTNNSWAQIGLPNNKKGWVSTFYIEANVPISSLPALAEAPPWAVVKTGTLNVRSGPGPTFSVVTTVNEGRLITLIGRLADNSWVKVVANGLEGWATTLYLTPSAPFSTLPVVAN